MKRRSGLFKVWRLVFGFFLALVWLTAGGMIGNLAAQGREEVKASVLKRVIEPLWKKTAPKRGLRVHQFEKALAPGTRVRPAVPARQGEMKEIVCAGESWLFFIDKAPGAHFAHPVEIVIWDVRQGTSRKIEAEWWPVIDEQPVFDTLEKRGNPATIIFDKPPKRGQLRKDRFQLKPGLFFKTHDPCSAWAVIVCGYDDLPDTFDEDTDGMYTVLQGQGIAGDHIFFISPHAGHPGVDQPTSIANVQWAIGQVAASADETDKVLFFYSSHGGIDSLSCVPGSPGGGSIAAADLDNWLDAITCDEMTIVVEACHSGSLIGKYADGTYVAAEDNLTGDGETNRCIFTSASTDTSSYPDEDWAGDPNPGDSGSETIWGYVEAFGTAAADTNGDTEISFGEAYQYAWNNDITRITGVNTPQMSSTGLNINNVYNYCYRLAGNKDLFIADGPADVGHNSYDYDSTDIWVTQDPAGLNHQDVVSGMDNYVHVAVHNRGTNPVANGTLKVYWADSSTATAWPASFTQIGTTQTFGPLASGDTFTYTWTWFVEPAIGTGHNFCLVGVSDSPEDPVSYPAGITYVAPHDNNIGQKNITIIEDPGHGFGVAEFVLQNNTLQAKTVDLVMNWTGRPAANAVLQLPDDLQNLVVKRKLPLQQLRWDTRKSELLLPGGGTARLSRIPLEPGQKKTVRVRIRTEKTKPGDRVELRLEQMSGRTHLGGLTIRLQQVDPADPGWVARTGVEAFSALALKWNNPQAAEMAKLLADLLKNRRTGDEGAWREIWSRMPRLLESLTEAPPSMETGLKEKFIQSARLLGETSRAGEMKRMLKIQGEFSLLVREILAK